MKLSKDKTTLVVNPSLTLGEIPAEISAYRPGNRSALEWVIDQYQIFEDKRSGIVSDPNREEDEEYIVRLVGQAVKVSVETVAIVDALPEAFASEGLARAGRPAEVARTGDSVRPKLAGSVCFTVKRTDQEDGRRPPPCGKPPTVRAGTEQPKP